MRSRTWFCATAGLVLGILLIYPSLFYGAADSPPEEFPSTSSLLRGHVFTKHEQPLAGSLVVLAEEVGRTYGSRYEEVASVLTDSDGLFLFPDTRLLRPNRNYAIFAWKRSFQWGQYRLTREFLSGPTKVEVNLYLDQYRPCPKCAKNLPFVPIDIFYATDRNPVKRSSPGFENAPDPSGTLHYGLCRAGIEELSRQDPVAVDKGFVDGVVPYASASDLFAALSRNRERNALIFIHGYENSFDDACSTAAQIAHDIRFTGDVLIYSWPSADKFRKYWRDEKSVHSSIPHFRSFLVSLSDRVPVRLQLVAHSMGNRALIAVVTDHSQPGIAHGALGNVVFIAPDVDREDFTQHFKAGVDAERVTLYASSKDLALQASEVVHSSLRHPNLRAGDAFPEVLVLPFMESVDASYVDTSPLGHTYYQDSWSVLSDLHFLIQNDVPARQRFGLVSERNGTYWVIQP